MRSVLATLLLLAACTPASPRVSSPSPATTSDTKPPAPGATVLLGVETFRHTCQRGLATRGGAEGVGRATTSAVVTSLFAIVVVDAIFTVLFNAFGL